jgi:predicted transcriptional regulator with HTH domain
VLNRRQWVVLLAAVPTHLYLSELGAATEGTRRSDLVGWAGSLEGVWAGVAAVVVLGLVATLLPLFLGLRHFRHLEA